MLKGHDDTCSEALKSITTTPGAGDPSKYQAYTDIMNNRLELQKLVLRDSWNMSEAERKEVTGFLGSGATVMETKVSVFAQFHSALLVVLSSTDALPSLQVQLIDSVQKSIKVFVDASKENVVLPGILTSVNARPLPPSLPALLYLPIITDFPDLDNSCLSVLRL